MCFFIWKCAHWWALCKTLEWERHTIVQSHLDKLCILHFAGAHSCCIQHNRSFVMQKSSRCHCDWQYNVVVPTGTTIASNVHHLKVETWLPSPLLEATSSSLPPTLPKNELSPPPSQFDLWPSNYVHPGISCQYHCIGLMYGRLMMNSASFIYLHSCG